MRTNSYFLSNCRPWKKKQKKGLLLKYKIVVAVTSSPHLIDVGLLAKFSNPNFVAMCCIMMYMSACQLIGPSYYVTSHIPL